MYYTYIHTYTVYYFSNPRYLKINQIVCITKGNGGATILWWQQLQIIWVLVSVTIYYKCNEGSIIYAKQLFHLQQSYKKYDVAGGYRFYLDQILSTTKYI